MQVLEVEKVGEKARQAVKWSISSQIVQKIFFLATSVLLARILTPSDFGLASMCITLDTIVWIVLSLGIISALMHFQDNIEERLNAAFWLIFASSSVLVFIQILLAPIIAQFYNEPLLVPIIRTSAVGLLITSFGSVQRTILAKNLEFKKISILETSVNVFRNVLYIIFALAGFKVWSFIYPKIIVAIISAVCLWNITKWRPQFKLYFKYWGEMFGFGKNVLFSNILDYIINNSSYILIGNFLGASMLGIYSFAYDKSMLMVNSISAPVTNISFPTFARLQNDGDKLKAAFLKTIKSITLITFPFAFFQLVLGNEFITGVFGDKWKDAVVLFQIIVVFSLARSVSQCCNPILQAIGKPNIALNWNLIYAPVYILSIYIGFKLGGIIGIGAITTFVGVVGAIIYIGTVVKTLKWSFNDIFHAIQPALFSSIIMVSLLLILIPITKVLNLNPVIVLISLIPIGVLLYILSVKLLFKNTYEFISQTISKLLHAK